MPLVGLTEVLSLAENEASAVGCFDITGEDMFFGVLDAAVAESAPVIISIAEVHLPAIELESLVNMIKSELAKAPVPAALHLDHTADFGLIRKALDLGFTSVMFDGSHLTAEQNIEQTREIVRLAHDRGVSVEGELGYMGGEGGSYLGQEDSADPAGFTDPALVTEYLKQTGVDALAVAFGTVHGLFRGEPQLDLERLEAIHRLSTVPLVLHGGSGLRDDDFRAVIRRGVRKINFYSEISRAGVRAVQQYLLQNPDAINYHSLSRAGREGVARLAGEKIRLWREKTYNKEEA